MPYHIKDAAVDRLIRELALRRKKPIIDAIRDACQEALDREKSKQPFLQRIEPVRRKVQVLLANGCTSSDEAS